MTFKHINAKLARYERRLEKQRIYQENHRAKLAAEREPDRPEMADALLYSAAEFAAARPHLEEEFLKTATVVRMLDVLEYRGFDRTKSLAAFRRMIERVRRNLAAEARERAGADNR